LRGEGGWEGGWREVRLWSVKELGNAERDKASQGVVVVAGCEVDKDLHQASACRTVGIEVIVEAAVSPGIPARGVQ
jgi:hypothetical protein